MPSLLNFDVGRGLVRWEMAPGLDDLAQLHVETLDRIRRVEQAPLSGGKAHTGAKYGRCGHQSAVIAGYFVPQRSAALSSRRTRGSAGPDAPRRGAPTFA